MKTYPNDNIFIVLPAYNEGPRIGGVLNELLDLGYSNVIVVDDASTDNTFEIISKYKSVTALQHSVNLGAGAATYTGIEYALNKGASYIAMLDADHQHSPYQLASLIDEIKDKGCGMVVGSRFLTKNDVPIMRKVYNRVGNIISYMKTGAMISDSQSGMKVISRKFAQQLYFDFNGFEYCIDMIKKAKLNNVEIVEKPISVVYTKETLSKGQSFQNGLMMLGRLLNPF